MTTTALAIPAQMRTTLEERRHEISDALPEWVTADRFIITTLTAIGKNPALQKCTQASMYLSIIECARIGLYPDNKEAALVPFGKEAVLIPMIQGIIRLMLRSPGVLKVEARVVYEGDDFQFEYGLRPNLIHRPPIGGSDTNAHVTHAYAIGWRQGTDPTFEVMTIDELELVRSLSKSANSPAYKNYVGEMYRKIVLKRLSKYFDLSPEANRAIALDHLMIGDSTISGSLDGPSEEYQNLVVKTQTVARLEELKEELNEKDGDAEPPAEDEKKEKSEPAPEPESEEPVRLENQWEKPILEFIIDNQIVRGDNDTERQHRVVAILNFSPFMEVPFEKLELVEAVAWILGSEKMKDEHPRMKLENRSEKVLALWEDEQEKDALIELAIKHIPPD